jgi:hypothetical protein
MQAEGKYLSVVSKGMISLPVRSAEGNADRKSKKQEIR